MSAVASHALMSLLVQYADDDEVGEFVSFEKYRYIKNLTGFFFVKIEATRINIDEKVQFISKHLIIA
jgi:hypothetical protein